ncbi:PspC domain-containing protein [Nocardioides sp.]|uniref:PspC domain-containing protein n=1 Tax=Nocardioides sp. TaxID=35761 RepID=UPI002732DDBD|nr:PspC domain-containing protein [Nocardioides sp.]MDP3890981.1 PspC domain-containing protein [Nocardioides sp.]
MNDTPPTADPPASGPRVDRDHVRDLGRLRRSVHDRHLAGVSGGLGRHLDIDPVIIRVGFVVLALFGGAGLLLYLACWLLVPEEGQERAVLDLDARTRTIALIGAGAIALLATVGGSWGGWGFPWPLALIALVVVVILGRRESRAAGPAAPGTPGPAAAPGAAAPGAAAPGPTAPATTPGGYYWTPPTAGSPAGTPAGAGVPPAYTAPAYAPMTYAAPQPPRDPRKRGPRLFWITMAMVALGWGVLGMVDVAGADLPASAYPALALTVIGGMLLVGAWFGRAGGLILVGLVTTIALVITTAIGHVQEERRYETPTLAAQVEDDYWLPAGELVLDLTGVRDLEALHGRSITVGSRVGRIEVLLPEGLDAEVTGRVAGPGSVEIFGQQQGGVDISASGSISDDEGPGLTLDVRTGVGEIIVKTK